MTRIRRAAADNEPQPVRSPDGGWEIKTYYPTWEQMKDFSEYMKHIHETGGHRAGLAKIVPPQGYKPRKAGYDDEALYNMEITSPIRQQVDGKGGLYQQLNEEGKKKMLVRNFKKMAENKHPTPMHTDNKDLDRLFWRSIFANPSIYGADVPGTLYDDDCDRFNLTKLNTILDNIQDDYGVTIQGVNTTYLYFGMWKSSFSWHTEDMDLYSINYLHFGEPKSWYCIAPEHGKRFEGLAASFFPLSARTCRAFLRHKTTLISPQILKKYSIPFSRMTQNAGEFMVTFPYSYHSGFNHGFNIAEATNFATEYWIEFGKWATRCECSSESVKISMQTFVKRYQSDRYEDWLRGKDICKDPRDPKHVAAAPKPSEYDLYLMGVHSRDDDDGVDRDHDDQNTAVGEEHMTDNKPKKKKPVIDQTTLQTFNEIFAAHSGETNPIELKHYAPVPTSMVYTTETPTLKIPEKVIDKKRPDYDKIQKRMKKLHEKNQEREERLRLKKEKRAKERRVSSNQLLHFLPVSFTHEKRFNRCISAQTPHCSICQLLIFHPKEDDEIWEPKPSVRILQASTQDTSIPSNNNDDNNNTQSNVIDNPSVVATQSIVVGTSVEEQFELPKSSRVLLPRSSFMRYPEIAILDADGPENCSLKSEPQTETDPNNTETKARPKKRKERQEDGEDRNEFIDMAIDESDLIQCSICMLSVHKLCYGLEDISENNKDWICDRCIEPNRSLISCALCPCRGGALKAISNTWVHVTCALSVPNFNFIDLIKPKHNSNIRLPEIVDRSTCYYCAKNMNMTKYVQGKCVSCIGHWNRNDEPVKCPKMFHTTCGHRNGAKFDYFDLHIDPNQIQPIRAKCHDCLNEDESIMNEKRKKKKLVQVDREEAQLGPIKIGTSVMAKTGDSFQRGVVENASKTNYFDIFYPESNEIDPGVHENRIIGLNLSGEYRIGDPLTVRSSGENDRTGKIKAHYVRDEYQVRFFETNQPEWVVRENIYNLVDQMPIDLANQIADRAQKQSG